LALGKRFFNAFVKQCSNESVTIDDGVIADAFLAQERGSPSLASGIEDTVDAGDGIMWLVEKCRPTTVVRYSGTLSHRSQGMDQRSSTIYAFSHFVYGHSNKTLVIADLQGTPSVVKGNDGLVLFDPMKHTTDGNSGIGDFGVDGIKTFIRDHQCGDICRRLGLDKSITLGDQHGASASDSDIGGGDSNCNDD